MKPKLFQISITDFEEVYSIIDNEKQRLHVSAVNYSFSTTLDLARDLDEQITQITKDGDQEFNKKIHQVLTHIIQAIKASNE